MKCQSFAMTCWAGADIHLFCLPSVYFFFLSWLQSFYFLGKSFNLMLHSFGGTYSTLGFRGSLWPWLGQSEHCISQSQWLVQGWHMTQSEPVRPRCGPLLKTVEKITISSFPLGFPKGLGVSLSLLDAILPL